MDSKYQKYYDGLKGKDFGSLTSKYTSAISTVKDKINGIESTISTDGWSEKGLDIIKSSILPSLKNQEAEIEKGFGVISDALSKCTKLLSTLENLKSACDSYSSLKEDDPKKSEYKSKISALEKEADGIIAEINGLSFEFNDSSSTFSGYIDTLKDLTSFAALKAEFIGDVNDTSKYYIDPAYAHKAKDLVMFDNTTGEIIHKGDTIHLKPGETRILTVRLPDYAGEIDQVIRTSADGDTSFRSGSVITAQSDINPDPNVVDWVNYKYGNHWPQGVDLHTNYYEWIITATGTGYAKASQTCEYTTKGNGTPKCMTLINVEVS